MKKLKFFILILLVIIFLIAYPKPKEIKKETLTSKINNVEGITLVLDFGEGKISTYSAIKAENKTVYFLLKKIADEKNLELKIKEYSFGKLIEQIGGFENTKERAWIYFVNGKAGEVAADKMKVKDGDIIEWKYIKPEF